MGQQVCVIADDGLEHDSIPFEPSLSTIPLRLSPSPSPSSLFPACFTLAPSRGTLHSLAASPLRCTYIVQSGIMGLCHLISGDYFYIRSRPMHDPILDVITGQRGNNTRRGHNFVVAMRFDEIASMSRGYGSGDRRS